MYNKTTLHTEDSPSGIKIVRVHGDLDSMGTHMVSTAFEEALEGVTTHVVVDLREVSFISSAGMAMMLVRGKKLRQNGGKLTIAAASPRVLEVLSLAGFHELFDVYPTVREAVAALEN